MRLQSVSSRSSALRLVNYWDACVHTIHQQVLLTKDEEHQQELAVKETEFKQLQKKYDALNAPSWMSIFSLIFLILITLRVYNINFNDFDYEAIFYSTP